MRLSTFNIKLHVVVTHLWAFLQISTLLIVSNVTSYIQICSKENIDLKYPKMWMVNFTGSGVSLGKNFHFKWLQSHSWPLVIPRIHFCENQENMCAKFLRKSSDKMIHKKGPPVCPLERFFFYIITVSFSYNGASSYQFSWKSAE